MRIDIACFTDQGHELGTRLVQKLREAGDEVLLERCGDALPLRQWVAEHFHAADALVFIGATGIAVRAIAPQIVSKTSDPAVAVLDDGGRFAVSLLSGHVGGANALTQRLAAFVGATPVITTATDNHGVFAVDVWAAECGMEIINPERIKAVSRRLLAGRKVKIRSAFPMAGEYPAGVARTVGDADILVDINPAPDSHALLLVPPVAVLGIGCRKGVSADALEEAFLAFCEWTRILPQAFGKMCSIDLKARDPGLLAFGEKRGLPFETFRAGVLSKISGDFSASPFVESVTGVDNVCERSAMAGAGEGGRLVAEKIVFNNVTMAAAVGNFVVRFPPKTGDEA